MTILFTLLSIFNVNAQNTKFYEAEYIDNIYISKYQYSNNTIYYQKARIFRETNTNKIAYCIEPFIFFNKDAEYEATTNISNISEDKIDKIKRIVYFGYGYKNHTDLKWYAITQYLIWQETTENGEIFFTDKLNGNKIYPYQTEINEIYNLIKESKIQPSFINKTHFMVENNKLILEDTNNVLNNYKSDYIITEDNKLILENVTQKTNVITLEKKYDNYLNPHIFYHSPNSQNLITIGNLENETLNLKINIINTNININKIDKDTQNIYPQGESSLNNAVIGLFDQNMNLINEYIIENNNVIIKNLNFGTYFIKEIKPGKGYNLNTKIYEINITEDKYNHSISIENEVIKKKIIIEKKYGTENNLNYESDIYFEIYNFNNELIDKIKTNKLGTAEIILPYGNYTIKQLNTTSGYQKIDPFNISIINQDDEIIKLTDYKIPIPNTSKNNILYSVLLFIINILSL